MRKKPESFSEKAKFEPWVPFQIIPHGFPLALSLRVNLADLSYAVNQALSCLTLSRFNLISVSIESRGLPTHLDGYYSRYSTLPCQRVALLCPVFFHRLCKIMPSRLLAYKWPLKWRMMKDYFLH